MTEKTPCFLYHEDCREGKIFRDAASVNEALAAGWVTGPQAIKPKEDLVSPPEPVSSLEPRPSLAPVKEKPAVKPRKPRAKGKK